jgi:hypothetical protein
VTVDVNFFLSCVIEKAAIDIKYHMTLNKVLFSVARGKWTMSHMSRSSESSTYTQWLGTVHNKQVQEQNMEIMDDILPPWMKHCDKF